MNEKLEKLITEEGVTEGAILQEMSSRPWRQQKNEFLERKDSTRVRIRNSYVPEGAVIRKPKPQPTINDSEYKKIAVYARVSTQSEEQVSSIENQTKYYTEKVNEKENWDLVKIYADEGKSGTSMKRRTEFKQMIQDAADQKFDTILCASVSRFARNVTDCIEVIKHLRTDNPKHPVGVYFETEGLYTLDPNSTMALFIHAMLADWESDNKSKRMILSYDQRISTGQFPVSDLLGYRHTKAGELIIQEEEAITVRYIFLAYLSGYSLNEIAETLTQNERKTLNGRTEWNAAMVRHIMGNERRWGDLEARKKIVIDYKEKKTVRNEDMRVSAFVPDHHEGIVSRNIATAIKMINDSRDVSGVPEVSVIKSGGLKGFVSVTPSWCGMNAEIYDDFCRSAYSDEELRKVEHEAAIISGKEHAKEISFDLVGYEVPNSAFFIDSNTPTLTITRKNMKINRKLYNRFLGYSHIEFLYHPLLQALIIRTCNGDCSGAVALNTAEGNPISAISAEPFCEAVYEEMDWITDYSFRFKGVMRKCENGVAMLFFLDEPQILVGNSSIKASESGNYIPYRKSELNNEVLKERNVMKFGLSYAMRKRRDGIIRTLSSGDLLTQGIVKENPIIGEIPSKKEIKAELDELLMSM